MKTNDMVKYFGETFKVISINGELVGITNGRRTYNVPGAMLTKIETAVAEPAVEIREAPKKATKKRGATKK